MWGTDVGGISLSTKGIYTPRIPYPPQPLWTISSLSSIGPDGPAWLELDLAALVSHRSQLQLSKKRGHEADEEEQDERKRSAAKKMIEAQEVLKLLKHFVEEHEPATEALVAKE